MNQVQLSRSSGISESMLTRIRSGDKPRIDPEDLLRLTNAVAKTPVQKAQLLRAHLRDEAVGPAKDWIRIEIAEHDQLKDAVVLTRGDHALQVIHNNMGADDVAEIIIRLAHLIETGDVSLPPPAKK